jgi:hypothetical protein
LMRMIYLYSTSSTYTVWPWRWMAVTSSTATWCGNDQRTELTSIINYHESLKSLFTLWHEMLIFKLIMRTDNIVQYCDTRPESRNNSLPDNSLLTHISMTTSQRNQLLGNGSVNTA